MSVWDESRISISEKYSSTFSLNSRSYTEKYKNSFHRSSLNFLAYFNGYKFHKLPNDLKTYQGLFLTFNISKKEARL